MPPESVLHELDRVEGSGGCPAANKLLMDVARVTLLGKPLEHLRRRRREHGGLLGWRH